MKRHLSRKQFLSLSALGGLGLFATRCTLDDTTTGTGGMVGTNATGAGGSSTATSTSASSTSSTATTGSGGSAGSGGSSTSGGGSGGKGGAGGSGGSGGAGGKGGSGGSAGSGGRGGSGGAGGSKDAGADGGGICGANVTANVSMNHATGPHALIIPAADIAAGVAKVYVTTNVPGMTAQTHMHWVQVTAADFTALKAGMTVTKHSCSGQAHEYVLKCGGTNTMGGAPTCTDMCGGAMTGTPAMGGPC
jgi:hypothetical protein